MKSIYLMRFTAKCRTIINLGFFSLVWITSLCAMTFDQTRLYNNATQFGNKTSNLYELANIVVQLNAHKPNRFVVPAFLGISHADISSYLSHVGVIQFIDEQWSKLPAAQPLNTTVLTQETKKILAQIRRSIIDAFDKYPFQITDQARMKTLENFLQKAADAKQLLMVRSTGREDSKKFANAGGNESIAAVSPDIQPVSKAIGEVVASYFSEKSMEQRLIGEPEKLLDSPFMPVLLQVMVGELPWERDTQIPVSGVIFSEEAEGTTPGVTNIQATYGHNEGVVNGLIPVDTFYIGPSKIIHPLIQIKDERLKAVGIEKLKKGTKSLKKNGIGKLERVTNPVTIQKTPCLDKSILEDLKYCADFIEKYYGYAVDIEFVVLNNVINLVQARPLTYKSISPSYLNENFVALPTIEKISVTTIGFRYI